MSNETNQSWTARMLAREMEGQPELKEGEWDYQTAQAERRLINKIASGEVVPPEGA